LPKLAKERIVPADMANDTVVLRFSDVTFEYGDHKLILDEASFSVRNGSKIALMGQNGAGKTSLFKLILGENKHRSGGMFLTPKDATVGIGKQVFTQEQLDLTVRDLFASTPCPSGCSTVRPSPRCRTISTSVSPMFLKP
jgi:ATPase subunit of ABC transporter with duplicated ATPase domains